LNSNQARATQQRDACRVPLELSVVPWWLSPPLPAHQAASEAASFRLRASNGRERPESPAQQDAGATGQCVAWRLHRRRWPPTSEPVHLGLLDGVKKDTALVAVSLPSYRLCYGRQLPIVSLRTLARSERLDLPAPIGDQADQHEDHRCRDCAASLAPGDVQDGGARHHHHQPCRCQSCEPR
jgi:hypothetical protein